VQAHPYDTSAQFGWKSSTKHWNDDAVFTVGSEPYFGFWEELRYPYGFGHPLEGNSIDLAFAIDGNIPCGKPEPDMKWCQKPDLTTNGVDVKAMDPVILADDFECNETTKITDITVWGSWRDDYLPYGYDPNAVYFSLSIHKDIPANDPCYPHEWSMPGDILWFKTLAASAVSVEKADINEGWYDPYYYEYYFPGDHVCWKYTFRIDPNEAFCQQGEPNRPVVYWLDVQAHPYDTSAQFGWKSSTQHWNDDAAWTTGVEPLPSGQWWNELRYPSGHELYGQSIDLAFAIDGNIPCTKSEDFGDAPDSPVAIGYQTLLANNGARHTIDGVTFMGALVDAEADGQPTINADGDDLNPPIGFDDEDGVVIPVLIAGQAAVITVTASVPGALDAWIDFGADGSWTAGDQIAFALPLGAGLNSFTIAVPATAAIGQTYARFRFSTAGGLPPFGPASNGEVEDYAVFIEQPPPVSDLGDAPDSTNSIGLAMTAYPSGTIAGFPTVYAIGSPPFGPIHWQPTAVAWLGNNVTLENEADIGPDQDAVNNITPALNTPDQDGADDGVLNLPLLLPHCLLTTFKYQINVVNPNIGLYVNVWFDWNRDGDWDDIATCGANNAPERAVQNQFFPAGSLPAGLNTVTSPQFRPWHPTGAQQLASKIWMRITLSEQPWSSGGGTIGDGGSGPAAGYAFGETEDYYFTPITECLKPTALEYLDWVAWGRPNCWCYKRQCRGDADGIIIGPFWVNATDLAILKAGFNRIDAALALIPNGICGDLDHVKIGPFRVNATDLAILKLYFNKLVGLVPCCDTAPIPGDCILTPADKYTFWTN
jgi:hypothetical protein